MVSPMIRKHLVIGGRIEVLRNIEAFRREVYLRTFSTEEAEARLAKLSLIDAVALWRAGLPQSRAIHEPTPCISSVVST